MQQVLCDIDTRLIFRKTQAMELEKASIMVVDDDPGILHSARMFLKQVFSEVHVT